MLAYIKRLLEPPHAIDILIFCVLVNVSWSLTEFLLVLMMHLNIGLVGPLLVILAVPTALGFALRYLLMGAGFAVCLVAGSAEFVVLLLRFSSPEDWLLLAASIFVAMAAIAIFHVHMEDTREKRIR